MFYNNSSHISILSKSEHVYGSQNDDMGGALVRSIGLVRARARIGLKNLASDIRRLVQLEPCHGWLPMRFARRVYLKLESIPPSPMARKPMGRMAPLGARGNMSESILGLAGI